MKEQIISWLLASHIMSAGTPPANLEVCSDHAVANSSGFSGVLVRNRCTGVYWLWNPTATFSIDQRFAKQVHAKHIEDSDDGQ